MGSPWYSIEGHPKPFEGNLKGEKREIVRIKLLNATFSHIKEAAGRIATPKIMVGMIKDKGLHVLIMVTEPSISEEEIQEILMELKLHLGSIINARAFKQEVNLRRSGAVRHTSLSRESGYFYNRPLPRR